MTTVGKRVMDDFDRMIIVEKNFDSFNREQQMNLIYSLIRRIKPEVQDK